MKVPIKIVPQLLNQMNAWQREMMTVVPTCTTSTIITTIHILHHTPTPIPSMQEPATLLGWVSAPRTMGLGPVEEMGLSALNVTLFWAHRAPWVAI